MLIHFTMSLDGIVAGPGHTMDFMSRTTASPGLVEETMAATGAVMAGRDGFDSAIGDSRPYDAAWRGAVWIGLEAAKSKNLEVLSPNISKQLMELGLVDELVVHVAPVLPGDGIRLYDAPAGKIIHLQPVEGDPMHAVDLRVRPLT